LGDRQTFGKGIGNRSFREKMTVGGNKGTENRPSRVTRGRGREKVRKKEKWSRLAASGKKKGFSSQIHSQHEGGKKTQT